MFLSFIHTNGVSTMGRVAILLEDEIEQKMRKYIAKKWPLETYGKLSHVVNEALKEYFEEKNI